MLKLLGSVLIISVTTYLGFSHADSLKEREKNLSYFISSFFILRKDINFSATSLLQIFAELADADFGKVSEAFYEMNKALSSEQGVSVYDAWESIGNKHLLKLSVGDFCVLDTFFKQLGTADRESELINIDKTLNLLESNLEQAKAYTLKNAKMYRLTGVASGLAIVIFLV